MAEEKKDPVVTLPKLKEPTATPKGPAGTMHIDLYLQAKGVRLWERGGKKAFAKQHNKSFATEKDFDELFKKY